MPGISKSQVSRLCKEIDERVKAFAKRLDPDQLALGLEDLDQTVRNDGTECVKPSA